MKIVQSFWSGNKTDFTNNYGWYSFKHHWLSWILSCNQLVKYHKDVELYTDYFGYDILIRKLKLPYTKVHVVLDDLNYFNENLWAVGKIKTFQMQNNPFIHVDGDVFLWESLFEKFNNSNLIAQNLEITTNYYRRNWNIIFPQLKKIPHEMMNYHNGNNNLACNMGIIGGTNISFFREYTSKSFDFVNNQIIDWSKKDALNFNIFFEQVLFYEFAKQKNQDIDFRFNEISKDNDYKVFGDFDKVPNKTYLHLLGDYKRDSYVCKAMEIYIMKYYPHYYSNLMVLIKNELKNNNEITYLKSSTVNELIDVFKNDLKNKLVNNIFNNEKYLIGRDLYNEGLPNKFDNYIINNFDFTIVLLNCFKTKKIQINESIDVIKIAETNNSYRLYDLDEIDKIILEELSTKIKYFDFIHEMKKYFEDEEADSFEEFIFLIHQRLRNYLILKIISIYI